MGRQYIENFRNYETVRERGGRERERERERGGGGGGGGGRGAYAFFKGTGNRILNINKSTFLLFMTRTVFCTQFNRWAAIPCHRTVPEPSN